MPEPATLHSGIRRIESGTLFTAAPGGTLLTERYFHPHFRPREVRSQADTRRLHDDIAAALGIGRQAHAGRRHGRCLPVRWDRLHRHRRAGDPCTQPAADHVHHRFRARGFLRVDVAIASAEAIGARHVAQGGQPAEFVAALPEIVWYLDEPVADPALVPLFFIAREARNHVKVVLSGEGADGFRAATPSTGNLVAEPRSTRVPGGLRRIVGSGFQAATGRRAG